jgi:hypothetical protein
MKKLIIALMLFALAGCQASDEEIRADIAGKARKDLNFAGLDYTVKNGAVSFTGRCASQKALNAVKQNIRNIHVIKAVNYNVGIGPVVIDSLKLIKFQVDSILSKYPQVTANVQPDGITLKGMITVSKRASLIKEVGSHTPENVKDSLNIY